MRIILTERNISPEPTPFSTYPEEEILSSPPSVTPESETVSPVPPELSVIPEIALIPDPSSDDKPIEDRDAESETPEPEYHTDAPPLLSTPSSPVSESTDYLKEALKEEPSVSPAPTGTPAGVSVKINVPHALFDKGSK